MDDISSSSLRAKERWRARLRRTSCSSIRSEDRAALAKRAPVQEGTIVTRVARSTQSIDASTISWLTSCPSFASTVDLTLRQGSSMIARTRPLTVREDGV